MFVVLAVLPFPAAATLVTPDTLKCGQDTTFYIRSDDGQDDALLDVAYIDAATMTVDTLVVSGALDGGVRDYIYWTYSIETITEGLGYWGYSYDSDVVNLQNLPESRIRAGKTHGTPMVRSGSIIGAAMQFRVTTVGDLADSVEMWVWVNGDSVFRVAGAIDSTGTHGEFPVYFRTQPPDTDTFSAGDILNVRFKSKGSDTDNARWDYPHLRAELMYDD